MALIPAQHPPSCITTFQDMGVEYVIESTGLFVEAEKARIALNINRINRGFEPSNIGFEPSQKSQLATRRFDQPRLRIRAYDCEYDWDI